MSSAFQVLALVLAGATLGWTAMFSFLAAPQAFRDLDHGRASRFVRNAMRSGHPALAAASGLAAVCAAFAGGIASAAMLTLAAVLYLLAAWALAPRDDERPPPGGKRKLQTARIVASGLTAMIMPVTMTAIVLIAMRI